MTEKRTSGGVELTDELVEQLSKEAEDGYWCKCKVFVYVGELTMLDPPCDHCAHSIEQHENDKGACNGYAWT